MDDERLRKMAEQFCDRISAEHPALPPTSSDQGREFCMNKLLEFGRQVRAGARESHDLALAQIRSLTTQQYDRLTPREKTLGIGRVLQTVAELTRAHKS
jgi:hypothetical protein